jgi:hypothetical protein
MATFIGGFSGCDPTLPAFRCLIDGRTKNERGHESRVRVLDMDIISVLTIRSATSDDRAQLRRAIVELQDYECLLHATRLPGAQVADAYVDWMLEQTNTTGIVLVAEVGATFIGFVAGWIEETTNLGETPDSNRFGLVSDIWLSRNSEAIASPHGCCMRSNSISAELASRVYVSLRSP